MVITNLIDSCLPVGGNVVKFSSGIGIDGLTEEQRACQKPYFSRNVLATVHWYGTAGPSRVGDSLFENTFKERLSF